MFSIFTLIMYYVYTLAYKGDIFYIGMTKQLKLRYQQHCNGSCGTPPYEYIYWILLDNELPEINIVNHYATKEAALIGEYTLIMHFVSINHKLCNRDPNPIYNQRITCTPYPNYIKYRQANNYADFITTKLKAYHKNVEINYRYRTVDHTAIIGSATRCHCPMCSQLDKTEENSINENTRQPIGFSQ